MIRLDGLHLMAGHPAGSLNAHGNEAKLMIEGINEKRIIGVRDLIRRIETGMSTADDAREVERLIVRLWRAEDALNLLGELAPEIARQYGLEAWAKEEKP